MPPLGIGGPLKESINPQLSPVGPAQMTHQADLQGPAPNAPVVNAPATPGQPMVPGLPAGKSNPQQSNSGVDMGQYRAAMLRRLSDSGANPGMPPGRPSLDQAATNPPQDHGADIKGMLQNIIATRNSRGVMRGMQG